MAPLPRKVSKVVHEQMRSGKSKGPRLTGRIAGSRQTSDLKSLRLHELDIEHVRQIRQLRLMIRQIKRHATPVKIMDIIAQKPKSKSRRQP